MGWDQMKEGLPGEGAHACDPSFPHGGRIASSRPAWPAYLARSCLNIKHWGCSLVLPGFSTGGRKEEERKKKKKKKERTHVLGKEKVSLNLIMVVI